MISRDFSWKRLRTPAFLGSRRLDEQWQNVYRQNMVRRAAFLGKPQSAGAFFRLICGPLDCLLP
jgi:hypothetical protein